MTLLIRDKEQTIVLYRTTLYISELTQFGGSSLDRWDSMGRGLLEAEGEEED